MNIEPNIAQKALNFVKATTAFVKTGMPVRNKREIESCLTICNECVHYNAKAFNGSGKCGVCGCNLEIKTTMETEHCPLSYW